MCEKAKDALSAKHAMPYLRPGLVGFRAGMLAWFLYGCKKDRRTKELVTLFAIWVASYMLNSLVAYADQIESKGKRIAYPEIYAALPDEFTTKDVRSVLITMGRAARTNDVCSAWANRNRLIEQVKRGVYRKIRSKE